MNQIPSLYALDKHVVTDEERLPDASTSSRFRALNSHMKFFLPAQRLQSPHPEGESSDTVTAHLLSYEVDLYRLKRAYERNSPSLLIQSLFRGYHSRSYIKTLYNRRIRAAIRI